MTWPGLLGHCLTFFVPRAWVWYQEKNQVAREAGEVRGKILGQFLPGAQASASLVKSGVTEG